MISSAVSGICTPDPSPCMAAVDRHGDRHPTGEAGDDASDPLPAPAPVELPAPTSAMVPPPTGLGDCFAAAAAAV